jgi:hydrogenase maturation protein HypF
MAEHGLSEPVIGVAFDGTGHGTDGAVWGGEFLIGDYRGFCRAAHLRCVPMPGGEQAVREPWRMALAHLTDAEVSCEALIDRLPAAQVRTVTAMVQRRVNCPLTSSAGRLFDAVAALAAVRDRVAYEGQAAVELEWLATDAPEGGLYPFDLDEKSPMTVDTRSLIAAVAVDSQNGVTPAVIARRFHATLAEVIVRVCVRLRDAGAPRAVTLSGGVFLNALLAREAAARLRAEGFRVYRHRLVPPGDGGLSLGQLAVAAHAPQGDRDVPRHPRAGGGDLPRA